jgi:hypothetical protein
MPRPIEQNWIVLEYTGSGSGPYEIIACYPEYMMTGENLVKAMAAYPVSESIITMLTGEPGTGGSWPSGSACPGSNTVEGTTAV